MCSMIMNASATLCAKIWFKGGTETVEKIKEICADPLKRENFFDCLYDEICEQFTSDDDTPEHRYLHIVQKYLSADENTKELIDDTFMAVSGWRLSTLLENAYEKYSEDMEEEDEEDDAMLDCDGECLGCGRACADRIPLSVLE